VGVRSGLRPLVDEPGAPSEVTREERIVEQDRVVSVVGGKYTTYRAVAERVVDRVELGAGRHRPTVDPTRRVPIPATTAGGSDPERIDRAFAAEDAARVEDVLLRRTPWAATGAWRERASAVVAAWGRRFGRSAAEEARERETFVAEQAGREAVLAAWDGAPER